jgi:predicted DNA binding CopG/RHH family protein
MEPTIKDLEKMLKDNKVAFKQVQEIKKANQEKYARKSYVNNFNKVKVIKCKLNEEGNKLLPKSKPLY